MFVFVDDVQRNRLGDDFIDRLRRRHHLDDVAVARVIARLGRLAVDLHQPVFDQPLHAGAGEIADAIDEVLIDPAHQVLGDAPAEVLDVDIDISRGVAGDCFG